MTMRLIGRTTTAHYECGNTEPETVPDEDADIVVARSDKGVAYEWRMARDARGRFLEYRRTAGPMGWLATGDDIP